MTGIEFSEYWGEVDKLDTLPQMAIQQLPSSLSESTKKRLIKIRPEDTIGLLKETIEKINRGFVGSIENLVKKQL